MTQHSISALTSASQAREGNDPIFRLNSEAKARAAAGESILDATMGALMDDEGRIAVMPSVAEAIARVPTGKAAGYSPISGSPPFLDAVRRDLLGNSDLFPKSVAVTTPGGSGAIYQAIKNFVEPGHQALTTDYYWGPYPVIAQHLERDVNTFGMFSPDLSFDLEAMKRGIRQHIDTQGRLLLILNFPCHNPTGYSLDAGEWMSIAEVVRAAGEEAPVAVLLDLAYHRFGGESTDLWIDAVPTMLETTTVLLAWTASKSFCQYGARIGSLVALHPDQEERNKLANALGFTCRATWSNSNHLGQLAVTDLLVDPELSKRADTDRAGLVELLRTRVEAFNSAASTAGLHVPRYDGGFFVVVFTPDGEKTAAVMRDMGVYVIPLKGAVRVALCATPEAEIPRLVEALRAGIDQAEAGQGSSA
ncbi:MAG: aminotransferase class I/II-fold pyridoxal phosphate-dependent enzyme [Longimicrobiales bacterium]|nr:aminotransferase class I/II-fold pyridoxal phosphate-dependent enzyme [Longimicrobiales bacterium]